MTMALILSMPLMAQQTGLIDPLTQAQKAIAKRDWAAAESLLFPLTQSQPKNPFVFYEMAQVYENTNRIAAAKQIYQNILAIPDATQRQYAIVVRTPEAQYMTSLVSLAQAKLNVLLAHEAANAAARAANTASANTTNASVAATVPAITARVAAAPAAPTPSVLTAKAAPADTDQAIAQTMQSWASAWANKDIPTYLNHYVKGYRGDMRAATAWQKSRIQQIQNKKSIGLDFKDIRIAKLSPTKAKVDCKQIYTSDSYSNKADKTLVFVKSGDRWLIEAEISR